jgi:hypothetical protein
VESTVVWLSRTLGHEAELVGTFLPTFILNCLLASRMNIEDFVDAKCRCNLVNRESIAGSPSY